MLNFPRFSKEEGIMDTGFFIFLFGFLFLIIKGSWEQHERDTRNHAEFPWGMVIFMVVIILAESWQLWSAPPYCIR